MRDLIYQGGAVLWAAWIAVPIATTAVFGLLAGAHRACGGAKPW